MISYFQRWNTGQWIRFGFGSLFVVLALIKQEWVLTIPGAIFLLQAFLNKGCSGGSCPLG